VLGAGAARQTAPEGCAAAWWKSDNKEVVTALREIAAGKVTIEEPEATSE